jgi:HEAT repeat protein
MSLAEQSNDAAPESGADDTKECATPWSKDPRSSEELFLASLDYDDDACYDGDSPPWMAVVALRLRGTREVFALANKYCESENPKARARGLDVLGQLGAGKPDAGRPYRDDCTSIAIQKLQDPEPGVVRSAAWALAHLRDDRAVLALISSKLHSDSNVRHAVAVGLGGSEQPGVIETLIELTKDESDEVRNWATFSLGTQCKQDSPEIRAALLKRVDDTFEDARDEAIWGLAQRRESLGLRLVLERLQAESWKSGDEDVAMDALGLFGERPPIEKLCDGLRELLAREK